MYEKTALKVSHIEKKTSLLGPFNRFVIWVHGCCFNCEGCLAANTKEGAFSEIEIEELSRKIAESQCEGLTISGGEPFLQASELLQLIKATKERRDIGVIVYSGFTLDELQRDAAKSPLLSEIDILIDGQYVKELDDGRAYVESSNQSIHYLTARYADIGKTYYAERKRHAEIKLTPTQAVLIGVPSKDVLKIWRDIKEKSGGMHNDF
ncbi:MAG: radical SAM protein [Clostridium sp.]|nr:radical SAM protein [Clostridium sp.]